MMRARGCPIRRGSVRRVRKQKKAAQSQRKGRRGTVKKTRMVRRTRVVRRTRAVRNTKIVRRKRMVRRTRVAKKTTGGEMEEY